MDTGDFRDSFQKIPKISLHDHLDGAVRIPTIIRHAKELNISLPGESEQALADWINETCNQGSLVDYLKSFAVTGAVMQTTEHLRTIAREYVLDCVKDGVIYAETRWAPLEHTRLGLSASEAISAVAEGLAQGVECAKSDGMVIQVRQIITALRHENNSMEIAKLALDMQNLGVVGFDLAGPELGFPPSRHEAALNLLHQEGMPVTIHAGEADGPQSVLEAIKVGHARRIGHGVRIAEDIARDQNEFVLGEIAKYVLDSDTTLEIAPRSNLQTESASIFGSTLDKHPFDVLYKCGFAVTVNPDNRLMSKSSITEELVDLANAFAYSASDLRVFQMNALANVFCDFETKESISKVLNDYDWEIARS